MKINPLEPHPSINPSRKGTYETGRAPHAFGQVLKKTLIDGTCVSTASESSRIRPSIPVVVNGEHHHFIERMEKSLDHLERYSEILKDPKAGMHALAAATEGLKQDARDLGRMIEHTDSDHGIQPILRETMVLLSKEIARFERGDYLD